MDWPCMFFSLGFNGGPLALNRRRILASFCPNWLLMDPNYEAVNFQPVVAAKCACTS